MSSSSSSGFSDEDTEAQAPHAITPSASQLGKTVELAQVCSFCVTFRKPLRLPSFSRTELQEALLSASNGDRTHMELLAELHYKLAREHPTAKMEKMVQDWEKTLARKLQENWRKKFTANPMGGGVTYQELTVYERVEILDALCHWKLDTCAEIHKHIATLQKENNNEAIESLRAGEIGIDDKGVSYWYFGDECWVYAEEKPRWQLEERKSSYIVEFASAKKIRLSIDFDPDHNALAPPLRLPFKSIVFSDDVKQEEKGKKEQPLVEGNDDKEKTLKAETKDGILSSEANKPENEQVTHELVKVEKKETSLPSMAEAGGLSLERAAVVVKNDSTISAGKEKHGTQYGVSSASLVLPNGFVSNQDGKSFDATEGAAGIDLAESPTGEGQSSRTETPKSSVLVRESSTTLSNSNDKRNTAASKKAGISERPAKRSPVNVKQDGEHAQLCVMAVGGAKKRTIIDDDSSDSSSSDANSSKTAADKKTDYRPMLSSPARKKRKASTETTSKGAVLDVGASKGDPMTSISKQVAGSANSQASKGNSVTSRIKETISSVPKTDSVSVDLEETSIAKLDVKPASLISSSCTTDGVVAERENAGARVTGNEIDPVYPLGAALMSPTDPAAAPETFDITCESCKKCYDMRYLDPPLVERPSDEWRCFECLVNDARGWPRRRKSTTREPFSPRSDIRTAESSSRKRSSSSKPHSGSSSSLKKSKKSSSKSRSGSFLKKKSSHSSPSKRKSSGSKSSSGKKSSSSSRKRKKHKSSSSSRHRRSSSHSHHRRRHTHHHHEEFTKLVKLFRERQEQRLGIEEARINGTLQTAFDEGPQGWRVASSTLDELRALIQSLLGGSLEQDRLRGRLILIVKDQEKLEEQRRKQQELAWNILPRRQSSRIAIGRMKNQSARDSDAEEGYSDNDSESRRSDLQAKKPHPTADDVDGKQKHDRACRARRRHTVSGDDMDLDDEKDEIDDSGAGDWIDWSVLKGNTRRLSTVCLALVNRLLKEETSELFSRPVDPEIDGCPNYLSVIDHPMDLGTIRSRAEANFYRKWKLFKKDVELVWRNCRTFNAADTMVVQFADLLEKLSRSMCIAAEKKGVDRWGGNNGNDEGGDESENSLTDVSKAESHGSVNKAWTESSASGSRDSSDDGVSSDGDSDGDERGRKRRLTRAPAEKLQARVRSTRSSGTSSRTRRSTRNRSSKKRPAPTSSSEESHASGEDGAYSSVQASQRQLRGSPSKVDRKVDPPTDDEDFSDADSANNKPPPPQNGTRASPSPPPPPPQATQKRPKPRLVVSDSSNSDDSSDSDDNSSSSSSSDSGNSDSDACPAKEHPPPPTAVDAPAPPPPSPPPPATLPDDDKSPVRSSPKSKSAAGQAEKSNMEPVAKDGYTNSPPLLDSYLSPSPSSSSDFSSGDSDSSDGDSNSD